ncbi:MAG: hypothetical protein WCK43_06235 [bacterium]
MKKLLGLFCLGVLILSSLCFSPSAFSASDTGLKNAKADERVRVFVSDDGKRVTVIGLQPKSLKTVLVKFEGFSNSPWEGKIIPHVINERSGKTEYNFKKPDGGEWTTIAVTDGFWSLWKNVDVQPQGERDSSNVVYSSKESESLKGDVLFKEFLKQK